MNILTKHKNGFTRLVDFGDATLSRVKNASPKFTTGFTLVESLVAVTILSLSVIAAFAAVSGGISASFNAKQQVTAFYLAQESVETIKNIRDENALKTITGTPTAWLSGISLGQVYTVDAYSKALATCTGAFSTCPNLRQSTVSGLFGYDPSWPVSIFKRSIMFQQPGANTNEVKMTIYISWPDHGVTRSFQVNEFLYNRE